MNNKEYSQYVLNECIRQWKENQEEFYGAWELQNQTVKEDYFNQMYSDLADNLTVCCCDCQYVGDKYSFPLPNDLEDVDSNNLVIKHYYCCCGDCELYKQDVTNLGIKQCDYFEEL